MCKKNIQNFAFSCNFFFLFVKDGKQKNEELSCVGNSISYEWCAFQPSRSKTVEEDTFLSAKVNFSRDGKNSNINYV